MAKGDNKAEDINKADGAKDVTKESELGDLAKGDFASLKKAVTDLMAKSKAQEEKIAKLEAEPAPSGIVLKGSTLVDRSKDGTLDKNAIVVEELKKMKDATGDATLKAKYGEQIALYEFKNIQNNQ